MRVLIKDDIYIHSTGLGFNIERGTMRDVKDKETKEVTHQEMHYDPEKHYTTLTGAINGLLAHYVHLITDDVILELNQLYALIQSHKFFIESKLGGL